MVKAFRKASLKKTTATSSSGPKSGLLADAQCMVRTAYAGRLSTSQRLKKIKKTLSEPKIEFANTNKFVHFQMRLSCARRPSTCFLGATCFEGSRVRQISKAIWSIWSIGRSNSDRITLRIAIDRNTGRKLSFQNFDPKDGSSQWNQKSLYTTMNRLNRRRMSWIRRRAHRLSILSENTFRLITSTHRTSRFETLNVSKRTQIGPILPVNSSGHAEV